MQTNRRNASESNRFQSSSLHRNCYDNTNLRLYTNSTDNSNGNISLWMSYFIDGDCESLVDERLYFLNKSVNGKICNLWECLFQQLTKYPDMNKKYKDYCQLKSDIYTINEEDFVCQDDQEHFAMETLSNEYDLELIFSSIDRNLKEIIYGENSQRSLHFLHIGKDLFLSLEQSQYIYEYIFDDDEKKLIADRSNARNKESIKNENLKKEIKNFNKIKEQLRGKQKPSKYIDVKGQGNLYYEIWETEDLENSYDLIKCQLHLIDDFTGIATPIDQNDKFTYGEIHLNNRKNCGYNAYENDIVFVELLDEQSGKVVGVDESNHKPVNNIYICKVSKDQGSLMTPLDKFIPKIRVDNREGRKKYNNILEEKKNFINNQNEKKLNTNRKQREQPADNLFYSLYKIRFHDDDDEIIFDLKSVEKFYPDTCEFLFIVCFEMWSPASMHPWGKIVGILSYHETFEENFHLLSSICNIEPFMTTRSYEKEVRNIISKVKCQTKSSFLPNDAVIFTIDDEWTKDMDDAISYHKEGNTTVIGVHITDVTKYLSPSSVVYEQAKHQFYSFFPHHTSKISPLHLFDERLATEAFSLVPNEPRAVISIFFKFNANFLKIDCEKEIPDNLQHYCRESVIISNYKLNYRKVSEWLKLDSIPKDVNKDLFLALKEIFKIALHLRKIRLPYSYFVRSQNVFFKNMNIEDSFEGRILIEEFMILTNGFVAQKIYKEYPDFTLLRVQDPVTDFDEWVSNLFKLTNMTFDGQVKEYFKLLNVREWKKSTLDLVISRNFYDKFCEYLKSDAERARSLLLYDIFYNDFFIHISEWHSLNKRSTYICSDSCSEYHSHFSLNKSLYTHFTSPIRRFIDIIVHLLFKSIIYKESDRLFLYSLDIKALCYTANSKFENRDKFKKICSSYNAFNETENVYCFIVDCACSKIDFHEISFAHPLLQKVLSTKKIRCSKLTLNDFPILTKDKKDENMTISCSLKWRKTIYFFSEMENSSIEKESNFFIDRLFDAQLSSTANQLFQEIRLSTDSTEKIKPKLFDLKSKFHIYENPVICSESTSFVKPTITIELKISLKNTMRIQFCKFIANGLPDIKPELYIVTPEFQICLIHQEDPFKYFMPNGKKELDLCDMKVKFESMEEYKRYFLPLIEVESVTEALSEKSAFTLSNISIKWIVGTDVNGLDKHKYGIIILSDEFCKLRKNIFHVEKCDIIDRLENIITKGFTSKGCDLLCLRFKKEKWQNFWVGHGHIVNIEKYRHKGHIFKVIVFRLTQSDFHLLNCDYGKDQFTIDVYPKFISSIRQQVLVESIDKYTFIKEIALGIQSMKSEHKYDFHEGIYNRIEQLEEMDNIRFNASQKEALESALTHKISLIWGPPGTGKTEVGCSLSYLYSQFNKSLNENGVVLYCGPSNDSINLVATKMNSKFHNNCPKLLRIFSEQQELSDFPLPGEISKRNLLPREIENISLHFLIRRAGEKAKRLMFFDQMFRRFSSNEFDRMNENIYESIMEYKDTVKKAKEEFIQKTQFQMILCTTSVAATNIISLFNITQVIIDEAGMCKEPETLIPIAVSEKSIKNIVLIGDEKQLCPIIKNQIASKRGLERSLFKRYKELRPDLVTMLYDQYRMHPSICEFPSQEFYSGLLNTKDSKLWKNLKPNEKRIFSRNNRFECIFHRNSENAFGTSICPFCSKLSERIIFIHVAGDESLQSVTISSGNENSRANKIEVEVVGHIYEKLINKNCLDPNSITVLTQYKLQQTLLEKKCNEILKKNKFEMASIVKTVICSQGSESDYVIFSTVRSLHKRNIPKRTSIGWEKKYLGFITDENQVNVALTRAKRGLIIIGNKNLLEINRMWKNLLTSLEKRECVIDDYEQF